MPDCIVAFHAAITSTHASCAPVSSFVSADLRELILLLQRAFGDVAICCYVVFDAMIANAHSHVQLGVVAHKHYGFKQNYDGRQNASRVIGSFPTDVPQRKSSPFQFDEFDQEVRRWRTELYDYLKTEVPPRR